MVSKLASFGFAAVVALAWQGTKPPAGATTVQTHTPGFRGADYISTTWDKKADPKYAEQRRNLDALWKKHRKGDLKGELPTEYAKALRTYKSTKDSRDLLYALGVAAFATMLCDGKPRAELAGTWATAKGNKSLEFARGIYLYEMSGMIDFTKMVPIGKALLERDKTDEPVLLRYARDVNAHAPAEARKFVKLIEPRLNQAYSDRLWAMAAAGVYISAKPTNATERFQYGLTAYQLLVRYEAMTGKRAYMGAEQLDINYHKYYKADKPFANQPFLFGPNAGR